MTKLLEKEALIQSHSRVIEQSNRQLARLTKQLEAENSRLSTEVEVIMLQKQYADDQAEISRHKAISQMVAGTAHEINTPISIAFQGATFISDALTLDTISELAKNEDAKGELIDVYKASKLIKTSIIQADKLISSFKNLSVRQVTDAPEHTDIKELMDELLTLYPTQQKDSKITIETDNSLEEDTKWFGYPGKLTQILLNLINNAQIHAYREDSGTVKIILTSTEHNFIIKIQDFGCGMSKESLDQVFPHFTRLDEGRVVPV